MVRFVDLRGQDIGYRFAFWSTCPDRFLCYQEQQAWDTFEEFEKIFIGSDLERFRSLCPDWVFQSKDITKRIKLRAFGTVLNVNPIYVTDWPFRYHLNFVSLVNAEIPYIKRGLFQITEEFVEAARIYEFVDVGIFDK